MGCAIGKEFTEIQEDANKADRKLKPSKANYVI